MNLDKRIKSKSDILSCFDIENAKEFVFVDQKGYFANEISSFCDINICKYGTLGSVLGDQQESFYMSETEESFSFFIPECFVKPKEKQYRPFTLNEFLHIYELGDIVTFRCKYNDHRYAGIVTGYEAEKETAIVHIGCYSYPLAVLFADYERLNENGYLPFGVEVEE